MSDQTFAHNVIQTIIYATISTVDADGHPWSAPQFFAYDFDKQELYWCAARESRHAQNIGQNKHVFVTVYDSSVGPGEGEGVYIQATAKELRDQAERSRAMNLLLDRHQGAQYWSLEDVMRSDSAITLFKANVDKAWVSSGREEQGQVILYRKVVNLAGDQ